MNIIKVLVSPQTVGDLLCTLYIVFCCGYVTARAIDSLIKYYIGQ